MTHEKLSFKLAQAAKKFNRERAAYYNYMASVLEGSGGKIKILDLFQNDIIRYEGRARGTLCAFWYDRYSENGGNLADTFQGTLPEDEVAIIRVAQDAGADALIVALRDVGRNAKLSDDVRNKTLVTLASGLFGIGLALAMLLAFPIFSARLMRENYDFLPLAYWGTSGKNFVGYAEWVKAYALIIGVLAVTAGVWIHWTIANYVSPFREWLDERIILYRVIRDLKGAMFLATMSTLTRKRAGIVFTLKQSLEIFSQSAKTPWLKWRINQVIDGADVTGAIGVDAFRTGMISREMFYYLEDMDNAKGFADGFEETGRYVESAILGDIIKKMMFYRWALLICALVVTLSMFSWQFRVIHEMKGAMQTYLASPH